ncbi:WxL domain-containing protein [Enterococcus sp. AZ109]|uniref:WxL domain-containing protein n=1 Tax=Enterococcus sp. AZ109 TaxID=2774634 RepID=UPI003F27FF9F
MKKTKLLVTGLLLFSTLLAGTATTLAATSNATIAFDPSTGEGNPSDPNNPSQENPNQDVTESGERGPLILKVVPYFNFGEHEVNQSGVTYDDIEPNNTYIEVRDNRNAAVDGWAVTASRTTFANADTTLPARLALPQGVIRNSNTTDAQGNAGGPQNEITNGSIVSTAADIPVGNTNTVTVLATTIGSNQVGKANTTSALAERTPRAQLIVGEGDGSTGTFASTITWTVTAGAGA